MVLYGLVEILKLKSKPLMNGRGYVVGNGRGYGVIQNNESVSQRGRHRAARAAKNLQFGMVCDGSVWFGMVWYGLVWFGMVWCGLV